jgi:prophage maintenance system killer protein
MDTYLVLNGIELDSDVNDSERMILGLAAS